MGFYEPAEHVQRLEDAGRKIVRLNVGNTNLPPPARAIARAREIMGGSNPGYGPVKGLPRLRRRIAEREGCGIENVVVGPGSKLLLYGLLDVLCDRGETVATPSPYYPAYALAAGRLGLKFRPIPTRLENGWSVTLSDIPKVNLLILCNPLNPTGIVYDENVIRDVLELGLRSGFRVILDEAYKGLSFREIPRYESAIRLRSFSKEFGLESWRLGYAVTPKDVADKLGSFLQATITCVPSFIQEAGLACLENETEIRAANAAIWRSRSETARQALAAQGFRFVPPDSGMYFFVTRPDIRDADIFCRELLDRTGVAVAPGGSFGGFGRFVRICANQPEDILRNALALLKRGT